MIRLDLKEDKEIEIIYDFKGVHIFRVNTEDTALFLSKGREFDDGVLKRLDEKKECKILYIVDKTPPLTAILNFLQFPFDVSWGAYAVVMPKDMSMVSKFVPIVTYGLGITDLKHKYDLKVFDNSYREDLTEVFEWLNNSKPVNQ